MFGKSIDHLNMKQRGSHKIKGEITQMSILLQLFVLLKQWLGRG